MFSLDGLRADLTDEYTTERELGRGGIADTRMRELWADDG
jgi:hypothetical protein